MNGIRPANVVLAAIAAAYLAAIAIDAATDRVSTYFGDSDYFEYAGAARLFVAGQNPYDWQALQALQHAHGLKRYQVIMMWNPPWVLPLVAPLAGLPWGVGRIAWTLVQAGAVAGAAMLAWRTCGGRRRATPAAVALALLSAPAYLMLVFGQITGLQLLGLAGFATWRRGRPTLAGFALALTAIKPHLLLPFALLLALDSRRDAATRRAVVWGVGWLALAAVLVTARRPDVWAEYAAAVRAAGDAAHASLADWRPPILAQRLREWLGAPFWAQFVPTAAVGIWLAVRWFRRGANWSWERELPLTVAASFLATGYGAWWFDVTLLLPLILDGAARLADSGSDYDRIRVAVGYVAWGILGVLAEMPLIWWAPALVAGYAWVAWRLPRPGSPTPNPP